VLLLSGATDSIAGMRSNASLSWTLHQDIMIVVQSPGLPSSADWSEYIQDARGASFTGVLVIGEDNKLGPTQRADVEDLLKRHNARNAVVTSSTITRGVLTALRWFGLPIKAFLPSDLDGALKFLAVPQAQHNDVLATLEKLKRLHAEQHRNVGGAA
jgi:hypothetical protein